MRYFHYLSPEEEQTIFYLPPQLIKPENQSVLEYALGATLYMPATRKTIAWDVLNGKLKGLMSMVLCLEDAIGDHMILQAEDMLAEQLQQLAAAIKQENISPADIPLIFVRVRDVAQMWRIAERLEEEADLLTGFVFPKFTVNNGVRYLEALEQLNTCRNQPVYGMPILESPEIIYSESRLQSLLEVKKLLDSYRKLVLNVRIGATDFSGLFGLRRSPDMTIYDLAVIRSCIDTIINVFTRLDNSYVVSGPVWEFYGSGQASKPLPQRELLTGHLGPEGTVQDFFQQRPMNGLLHEILLDKANGLTGKTIIHPSHIKPVQALCVVSHEEYMDACSILAESHGDVGVIASAYRNKMNEIKPHMRWAEKIMIKSQVYGVFHEQHNFTSLLA